MATSSTRTRPTVHPTGSMMLKTMTTATVNPAWPTAKEMAEGATPASRTAKGSTAHSRSRWGPSATSSAEPTTNPPTVPATALRALAPVPRAFDRNTDRVPSTTQNPCCTFVASATATARDRPTAPRTLFRNHTERRVNRDEADRSMARSDRRARATTPSPA